MLMIMRLWRSFLDRRFLREDRVFSFNTEILREGTEFTEIAFFYTEFLERALSTQRNELLL